MLKHLHIGSFILILLLAYTRPAKADHSAGGELLYEWIGDSTYKFTFKFYRDCSGIGAGPIMYLCGVNICDSNTLVSTMNLAPALDGGRPNGSQLALGCPNFPNRCASVSSQIPGYQEWWYTDTLTLPSRCTEWSFAVAQSSRNKANNIANIGDLILKATLNNVDAPQNSSAFFTVKPIPYVCVNNYFVFNNGAVDINNDSLHFDLQRPITYISCTNPQFTQVAIFPVATPSLSLPNNPFQTNNTFFQDPDNGNLNFTSPELGAHTVSFTVSEYKNGKKVGSVMRDVQLQVLPCSAPPISLEVDTPTIKNGRVNNKNIDVCVGVPLQFCFDISSTDLTAILIATDNHHAALPGANVTYTNMGTNRVRGCVTWTPTINDTSLRIFAISVKDSTCKQPGISISQTFTIPIDVIYTPPPGVTSPINLCQHQNTDTLNALGTKILWYNDFSATIGDPNAPTPSTKDLGQTIFYATQELNLCRSAKQPILVNVLPGPTFNINSTKDSVCWFEDAIIFNSVINQQFTKSWDVDSGRILQGRTTDSITADWSKSGYKTVKLTMANSVCKITDSIRIYVKQTPVSFFDIKKDICLDEKVKLSPYFNENSIYYWTIEGQKIYDSAYVPSYTFAWDSLGKKRITLRVVNKNGCDGGIFDTSVTVRDNPDDVKISGPHFNDICYGKEFELTVQEGLRYKYEWTPPLSFISYSNNTARIRAEESGFIYVKVSNLWDCSKIDSFYVDATPCCDIIMPDAFTPNGNGLNDYYKPLKAGNHTIISFKIMNRWGQTIYQSRDISRGWDGRFKGEPQDLGTYYYHIKYLCNKQDEQNRQGNFTLLR